MVPKWCFEPLTVVLAPHLVIRRTNYRVIVRNGVRTAACRSLETPLMDSHHRCIQNWKRVCGNTSNGVEDHSCRDMGRFLNPNPSTQPTDFLPYPIPNPSPILGNSKMFYNRYKLNENKSVSRLARRKSHHTALSNTAAPISECPMHRATAPCNTMSPGPRPTFVPSGVFIHPAVWLQ